MSAAVRVVLVATLLLALSCARNPPLKPAPLVKPDARPLLVPLPSSVEWKEGYFTLSPKTVIVATGEVERLGRYLSEFIGLGAGTEPLRVQPAVSSLNDGTITLRRRSTNPLRPGRYRLEITSTGISIEGDDLAGVFYAIQTLRQLLPPAFEYEALRPPPRDATPTRLPAATITDEPRFEWRGAMLDVARHFLSVEEVKRYLDLMALHKLNRLHLHLADDQGWRVEIKSWPNLAVHGGSTEVGGGSGGYYTQSQYVDIVRYAADRFITIVPEIDMPGHTNAALASYAELNCDGIARPLYTGIEVGFSALCVDKEITFRFIDDVVREIAAMTPGPYFHVGGDEVKTLTAEQYAAFIERVQNIVQAHGKQMIGWDEIAPTKLEPGSLVQHWRPKTTPAEAIAKGAKVIMSVANRAYLDMKYDVSTAIGLNWAGIVTIQTAYDWDPATAAEGVPASAVVGVEASLWSETLGNINDVEFLAFPRLAAIAEVAWSPQAARGWEDFRTRLGAQGPRWVALGLNFYRSPEVPWR